MLHQIDFEPEARQILPTVPTKEEMHRFSISPERHAAYENMWRAISLAGIVGNAAMWLYF